MFSAQDDFSNVFLLDRVMYEQQQRGEEGYGEFHESIMVRRSKDIESNPEYLKSKISLHSF